MALSAQLPYLDSCTPPRASGAAEAPHCAIVGAGLAGLAVAIVLARAGYRVSLFERFAEAQAVGAGLLLQPSGLAVLRHLGLLPQVLAGGRVIRGLLGDAQTAAGWRRIMDVRYGALQHSAPGIDYGVGIHRANLFRILLNAAQQAGARIHCGIEISQLGHHGEKHLLLDALGRDYGCCDAVIIANGSHGQLRRQLLIPQRCAPYPWGALWATLDDQLAGEYLLQRYVGAQTMLGVLPSGPHPVHGRPCLSFFYSLPAQELPAWRQQSSLAAWKQELKRLWPELEALVQPLERPEQLAWASYADVVMPYWHQGSLLCVGDAAHGMSPQLGQGTNLALIDAWVLGECLREQPVNLPQAFARYSAERRRHLRFYQQASRWLTPLFQSHSRVAAWARDLSFPWMQRFGYSRQQALRTVAGIKTGWVGDADLRLPDAEIGGAELLVGAEKTG